MVVKDFTLILMIWKVDQMDWMVCNAFFTLSIRYLRLIMISSCFRLKLKYISFFFMGIDRIFCFHQKGSTPVWYQFSVASNHFLMP